MDPFAALKPKYEIHPECYEYLKRGLALGIKPYQELDIEAARAQAIKNVDHLAGKVDFPGSEKEIFVPSPHTKNGILVSIYKPSSCPKVPAIMVYFHGGGLVLGSRRSHETVSKIISRDSSAIVVNVEYRKLPQESAKMAPFEDVTEVTKWVLAHRQEVGGHPDSKVGVGGNSSGGQLAISVTNELPGQLDFQMLVYPWCNVNCSHGSIQEFKNAPGLNADLLKWFRDNSMAQIPDYESNPTVNGAVRTNVATSPPALIILAELDPLRDMGLEYADMLRANGVPVQCHVIKAVPHGFFSLPDTFKTKSQEGYNHVIPFLSKYQ